MVTCPSQCLSFAFEHGNTQLTQTVEYASLFLGECIVLGLQSSDALGFAAQRVFQLGHALQQLVLFALVQLDVVEDLGQVAVRRIVADLGFVELFVVGSSLLELVLRQLQRLLCNLVGLHQRVVFLVALRQIPFVRVLSVQQQIFGFSQFGRELLNGAFGMTQVVQRCR